VPIVEWHPDEIDLFMFSSASWLLHRVHYDEPFTTCHDGHKALLVHGPLQGTRMLQCVQTWLGHTVRPQSFTFRHTAPAYAGDTLEVGGSVTSVNPEQGSFAVELWVRKDDGTITTTGAATFALPDTSGEGTR